MGPEPPEGPKPPEYPDGHPLAKKDPGGRPPPTPPDGPDWGIDPFSYLEDRLRDKFFPEPWYTNFTWGSRPPFVTVDDIEGNQVFWIDFDLDELNFALNDGIFAADCYIFGLLADQEGMGGGCGAIVIPEPPIR